MSKDGEKRNVSWARAILKTAKDEGDQAFSKRKRSILGEYDAKILVNEFLMKIEKQCEQGKSFLEDDLISCDSQTEKSNHEILATLAKQVAGKLKNLGYRVLVGERNNCDFYGCHTYRWTLKISW